MRAGHGGAVAGQVEPRGGGVQRLGLEVRRAPDLVPGLAGRVVAQRQHRAAREVEHRALRLVDGADPQQREPGRPAALLDAVLAPRDHLGRRVQRVAEPHRAPQQQPAVEEVRHDAARGDRRLPDRRVPHQPRVRDRRAGADRRLAQRVVEREPQPVARDRLVQRGVALGERERRRPAEDACRPAGPRTTAAACDRSVP